MALVDPYGPCPCGLGQKYKWCCQKVEVFAERSQRQLDSGQVESALATLDEGLKTDPGNPWLSLRKAVILVRRQQPAGARPVLEFLLKRHPEHTGARVMLIRVILETEGPIPAIDALQDSLGRADDAERTDLGPAAQLIAMVMAEVGVVPSALKHFELAIQLEGLSGAEIVEPMVRQLESDPKSPIWLRQSYTLTPLPPGAAGAKADRYAQAVAWADEGRWRDAAAAFELLAADGAPGADRNLGLCRLWLGDEAEALKSLRRAVAAQGETVDAVDLECLCQLMLTPGEEDVVERVQHIWPLRGRDALLKTLSGAPDVQAQGRGPLDPDDPNSFEVDEFELLDRPKPAGGLAERIEDQPKIVGRVFVGSETVILDTFDDGRLDDLSAHVRDLAGSAIPPAHPKTKELGKVARTTIRLRPEWWFPEGADPDRLRVLQRQERQHTILGLWPETPMPELGGRSPLQAAADGNARVPLRAALLSIELGNRFFRDGVDFDGLRRRLDPALRADFRRPGPRHQHDRALAARSCRGQRVE